MDVKVISDEDGFGKCAWCSRVIYEDSPVYGFGIRFSLIVDFSELEGLFVEFMITSHNRAVPMLITIDGSDAKEDGNDAMFMTCSKKCGSEMRKALIDEKTIGEMFEGIESLDD